MDGILLYDVTHLISAARTITARQVTLDPSWIIERLNDVESVLEDLNLFSENDEEVLQLLTRATPLPIPVIEKDPRQIIGRLRWGKRMRALDVFLQGHSMKHQNSKDVLMLSGLFIGILMAIGSSQ